MAITRSPMVDDDGSGTTGTIINNAWKTELYGQIDGEFGTPINWTPIDVSGAGLVFSVSAAHYVKCGRLVSVACNFAYPATSNGATAIVGGLPFPCYKWGGLYATYPPHRIYHIDNNSTRFYIFDPTGGSGYANSQLSGAGVTLVGTYITP